MSDRMMAADYPGPGVAGASEQALAHALLIDTHVHIYPCYDLDVFLDRTAENLTHAAQSLELGRGWLGCIALTETSRESQFEELRGMGRPSEDSPWSFESLDEPECLLALRRGGDAILLLSGFQTVSSEGLEVLSIGTVERVADGLPIEETISRIKGLGAVPVLPWGFGKWLGQRGQVIRRMIERFADEGVFLGDNAGRPYFGPRPALLSLGESMGMAVLPGTDPLPLSSCVDRAGRCGMRLDRPFHYGSVAAEVRDAIRGVPHPVRPFGGHVSLPRFLKEQAAMRLNRR